MTANAQTPRTIQEALRESANTAMARGDMVTRMDCYAGADEIDKLQRELAAVRGKLELERTDFYRRGYNEGKFQAERSAESAIAAAKAEAEALREDAERWRRVQRNPYSAWDAISAGIDVNSASTWARGANFAIDAERKG